jgi:CelD/BcsL family acetyltransferase involved in cellulose biosynthesis
MLSIEEINTFEKFLSLNSVWNRVLSQSDSNSVFLTFEWLTTWWKHFGKNKRVFILVIKDGRQVIGIAPWMIRSVLTKTNVFKKIEFIGTGLSTWGDFILTERKRECLEAVVRYLASKSKVWTMIDLRNSNMSSGNMEILREVSGENNLIFRGAPDSVCPYIDINSDWDSYFNSRFSKKSQRYLRRDLRRLERKGASTFKIIQDTLEEPDIMDKIAEIEQVRSYKKESDGRGLFVIKELKDFFSEVASLFSDKRWLNIAVLELNGQYIAYRFGFQYAKKYWDYNTAFDYEFANCTPGKLLATYLIEECFNQNMKEFDFLRGSSNFKSGWTNLIRHNYRIGLFKRDIASFSLDFLFWKLRPFLDKMHLNPITRKRHYNFRISS